MQQYSLVVAKLRRIQRLADEALKQHRLTSSNRTGEYAHEIVSEAMDLIGGSADCERDEE